MFTLEKQIRKLAALDAAGIMLTCSVNVWLDESKGSKLLIVSMNL